MRCRGGSAVLDPGSLIPARPCTQPLGPALPLLVLETPLVRRARRPRGLAHLRHRECPPDELRQTLLGLATVTLLSAVIAGEDEYGAVCGKAPTTQAPQPQLGGFAERAAVLQVVA